jgi:hypothetical protein
MARLVSPVELGLLAKEVMEVVHLHTEAEEEVEPVKLDRLLLTLPQQVTEEMDLLVVLLELQHIMPAVVAVDYKTILVQQQQALEVEVEVVLVL